MNIEVTEFPGWKCTNCGHTGKSRNSWPHECPGCHETGRISSYGGPTRKHPWVSHRTGQYGYRLSGDPTNDWCVTFHNLDSSLTSSFVVDAEYEFDTDGMTVLEVAEELAEVIDRYIYTSQKNSIPRVVEWLREHNDEHERLEAEYQVELCRWRLWNAARELQDAEYSLECLLETNER